MVDYLINSLDFSKDAAVATLNKVPLSGPSQKNADSVVNYLDNLGISKTHIRSMVSRYPRLLCSNVDKTLAPKDKFLRELGLSGLDLREFIIAGARSALDTAIKPRVLYLKQLVGTDDNVVKVLNKYPRVITGLDTELVESNLELLRNYGITHNNIVRWITRRPRSFFVMKPEGMKDILDRVENVLGIPRESATFTLGVELLSKLDSSKVDEKLECSETLAGRNR
ncbi:OLC1v1005707C2 [Oldenlandia corymbosa var. corymbosa]|nr:OLC1v1005707C2 [Oldenlandia corymbosa var. corymbosa]